MSIQYQRNITRIDATDAPCYSTHIIFNQQEQQGTLGSKELIFSENDNNSPYFKIIPEASIAATASCGRSSKLNII